MTRRHVLQVEKSYYNATLQRTPSLTILMHRHLHRNDSFRSKLITLINLMIRNLLCMYGGAVESD